MHQVLLNHHNQNQNEPACEGSAAERRNSMKRNNHCQDPQNGTQVLIHNSIVPRHYHWDVAVVSSQLMPTLTRTYKCNTMKMYNLELCKLLLIEYLILLLILLLQNLTISA